MKRCHAMLCPVLEQSRAATTRREKEAVEAQVVQCFKALREFSQQVDWCTAWPLAHILDLIENNQLGGLELEMECVLAVLMTEDDLLEKSKASRSMALRELLSDGEDEKERPGKSGKIRKRL